MESNFQQFLTAQLRTSDQLEKLTIEVRTLTGRVDQLSIRADELAQGMVQLTGRVDQLAEAQRRADERLNQLAARMNQLAVRMDQLTQRMDQLTIRMDELTEAQRRTEKRLDRTNRQLGDLSMSFGYPHLCGRHKGTFHRSEHPWRGDKNGDTYYSVGECKSQLSIHSINRSIQKKLERIAVPSGKKVFPIFVCHMVSSPEVASYAKQRGIALYFSHQFD